MVTEKARRSVAKQSDRPGTMHWSYFGLAALFLWSSFLLKPLDAYAPWSFVAYYLGQAVAFVCAVPLHNRLSSPVHRGVVNGFCALIALVSPWLAVGAQGLPGAPSLWGVLGGGLGGAAWAWFLAMFFPRYVRLGSQNMAMAVLLSFALFPLVRLPLEFVPLPVALGVCSLVPPLLPFWIEAFDRHVERRAVPRVDEVSKNRWGFMLIVAGMVLYGLVVGLMRVNTDTAQSSPQVIVCTLLLKIAFPLVLLAIIRRTQVQTRLGLLCQLALVFILVAITIAVNLRGESLLSYAVFDLIRQFTYVLLYFTLCALAMRTKASPTLVLCLGWAPYVAALGVGMVAAEMLGGLASYPEWLMVSLMCLLTCTNVIAFNFKDNSDIKLFADGSAEQAAPPSSFSDIDRRCEQIAASAGLTKRELEVMQLISKGRSKRYIAEDLVISENTVRTYAKQLYAKLEIHSRQELLTLLETVEASEM